jgi:hypothetical protein
MNVQKIGGEDKGNRLYWSTKQQKYSKVSDQFDIAKNVESFLSNKAEQVHVKHYNCVGSENYIWLPRIRINY